MSQKINNQKNSLLTFVIFLFWEDEKFCIFWIIFFMKSFIFWFDYILTYLKFNLIDFLADWIYLSKFRILQHQCYQTKIIFILLFMLVMKHLSCQIKKTCKFTKSSLLINNVWSRKLILLSNQISLNAANQTQKWNWKRK